MLALPMGSAPPSSGQESLKSGRRNSRSQLHHTPLRDLGGHRRAGDGQAVAHVDRHRHAPQYSVADIPQQPELKTSFIKAFQRPYRRRTIFVVAYCTAQVTPLFAVYTFARISSNPLG